MSSRVIDKSANRAAATPLMLPDDPFNRELVQQVHPPEWGNPQPTGKYDLVVIGAGTAGLVTAAGAAGVGAKVALIEKHLMGGDCLNVGCVPSKALISAARAAAAVKRAGDYGVRVPDGVHVDFAAVMERMRRMRSKISHHDSAHRFQGLGVDVYFGDGSFADQGRAVRVGDTLLRFKKAVICTGARAAAPPIPGLADVRYLTNENLFSLTELPRRLAVIGGGPIGCEMAQSFARFGADVTLFEVGGRLLPRDDTDASLRVMESLRSDGVHLMFDSQIKQISENADTKRIAFTIGGTEIEQDFDAVLVAVGRAPNIEGLNLEEAGVTYDRAGVDVDDRLRTSNPKIFAAGDICFPYKFTHSADFLARIVIQNALFFGRVRASSLLIPWCTYTSPEVAHVGLLPEDAAKRGVKINTFTQELTGVDRAYMDGEDEGFVKLHVRQGTDQIVGATVVAAHAGDLISEITVAMKNGVGLKAIGSTIHPYPTQAEAIRKLGDQFNRTRLTPFTKWLLKTVISLGR
ncbi:MAG: mercuric reductase [Planctomycetaceae bacterium]